MHRLFSRCLERWQVRLKCTRMCAICFGKHRTPGTSWNDLDLFIGWCPRWFSCGICCSETLRMNPTVWLLSQGSHMEFIFDYPLSFSTAYYHPILHLIFFSLDKWTGSCWSRGNFIIWNLRLGSLLGNQQKTNSQHVTGVKAGHVSSNDVRSRYCT